VLDELLSVKSCSLFGGMMEEGNVGVLGHPNFARDTSETRQQGGDQWHKTNRNNQFVVKQFINEKLLGYISMVRLLYGTS
jgi:hypothetical protein